MKRKNFTTIGILLVLLLLACSTSKETSRLIDFRNSESIKSQRPILVAHRGGFVTDQCPECSIAAIQMAKQKGFALVELDIRKSKDGVPIVFHDSDMIEACGVDNRIQNLDVVEIMKISFVNTDQKICTLDKALEACDSLQLGLMLDVKVEGDSLFFHKVADLIKKYGYENSTVTINGDPVLRESLRDVALLTVSADEFSRVQQGEVVDLSRKFWFGLPQQLPSEMVQLLQQNGAFVIPAINTFRYPTKGHYDLARKDIKRLNEAGVDGYQIDSVYQPLFFEEKIEN